MEIRKYPNGELVGLSAEMIRHHMELRGIGIINVKDLFGVAAVRTPKSDRSRGRARRWREGQAYDRLGLDETVFSILDRPLPLHPHAGGARAGTSRNLVEIAARNSRAEAQGRHSAREFARKLDEQLGTQPPRQAAGRAVEAG